jgi:hypothetical protein
MSELFDQNMYQSEDNADPTRAPALVSNKRVSVSNLGGLRRVEIDGETLVVVEPKVVAMLEQRVKSTELALADVSSRLSRADQQLKKMKAQIDTMLTQLNRIYSGND